MKSVRTSFAYGGVINWFPGHMAKASRLIREKLKDIDVIVEVRDARIPFSSANTHLDELTYNKRKLVICNKADLANPRMQPKVAEYLEEQGSEVMFTSMKKGTNVSKVLRRMSEMCQGEFKVAGAMVLIVGVPNVGKSALINGLRRQTKVRKAKKSMVNKTPGHTRSMNAFQVSKTPPIFMLDTPGVMLPRIDDMDVGLKLAATYALKDNVVDIDVIADYLLYTFNRNGSTAYVKSLGLEGPCDEIDEVLRHIAESIGALGPNGVPDTVAAATHFVHKFRTGELGRFTLDQIPSGGLVESASLDAHIMDLERIALGAKERT